MPISPRERRTCAYSGSCSPASITFTSKYGVDRADQHHVFGVAVECVAEDETVREHLKERGDLRLHRLWTALVELHEQRDDATGIQARLRQLENSFV